MRKATALSGATCVDGIASSAAAISASTEQKSDLLTKLVFFPSAPLHTAGHSRTSESPHERPAITYRRPHFFAS